MDSTLGSASQSSVTAIEQNDSSSSPQIDKADTDLSFYSARNEGEIAETTTIPALTPPPPFPSTLFSEISSEQIYGTQVSDDELDGNRAQLAYPPSDGTDTLQSPPLVPIGRRSQSQLNSLTRSATTSPPVVHINYIRNTTIVQQVSNHVPTPSNSAAPQGHRQRPSQYSQESYRVPTAQTPQTQTPTSSNIPALSPRRSGESRNSERSSSLTPQQYTNPLQQSAPTTPSMYSGIPSQPTDRVNVRHRHHNKHHRQPTPSIPQDEAFRQEDTSLAQLHLPSIPHIQPKLPISVSLPPVQYQAQERREEEEEQQREEEDEEWPGREEEDVLSTVSSIHHSPTIAPNADDTVTPPAVSVNRPSLSPSRSQDIPFTQHEPNMGASHSQPFTEPYTAIYYPPMDPEIDWKEAIVGFFLVGFPKQLYLLLLLRLPVLYFSRVARIFEDADMSLPEIKKMTLETASRGLTREFEMEMDFETSSVQVPHAYKRLTSSWEFFIDSVMREWKTFNIISVLLLTAILTILQIGSAADDPVTRYTALFSLMCSLIGLLFGCMYIIRFGTLRKNYKVLAAEWALEAKRSKTLIWWNVWILLAMPAIWLTWSIILFIACIMSFIWRTGGTSTTSPGLSDTGLLVIRIVMTVVLGIGVLYGLLAMITFQRYGTAMDKAWKQRVDEWIAGKAGGSLDLYAYPTTSSSMEDGPYSPRPYHRPTPSRYYQSSTGPPPSRSSTPSISYASPRTVIQLPPGSPHSAPSTRSDDASTINLRGPNQPAPQPNSWVPQPSLGGTTSAANPGATPPTLNPKGPVATAEEFPPRLIPERILPESSITSPNEDGDNALRFSSGLQNRGNSGGDDDAPDDGNRVRFRLPDGSSDISDGQGIIPS